MPVIKIFTKGEDAHLFAAWLGSQGVDSAVFEENAYGGNLLGGTTPGAIRVSVEADDETLTPLLREWDTLSRQEVAPTATSASLPREGRLLPTFRFLLVLDTLLIILFWALGDNLWHDLGNDVQARLNAIVWSQGLWTTTYYSYPALIIISLIANLLLWLEVPIGRNLYVATLLGWLLLIPAFPPSIPTVLAQGLGALSYLVAGLLLGIIYTSPIARRFA